MTKQQYLGKIREILDEAIEDDELSVQDYIALCEDVSSEAGDRVDATEDDIANEKVDADLAQEDGE
jgi:hypothetical protein